MFVESEQFTDESAEHKRNNEKKLAAARELSVFNGKHICNNTVDADYQHRKAESFVD